MANRFSVEAIFKGVDKISAPVSRMENRVQRFTQSTARGLSRVTKGFTKTTRVIGKTAKGIGSLAKEAGSFALKLAGGAAVGAGALTTLITLMSKADVEARLLAQAVGFNVDELEALSGAVSGAGFQFDNIVDLIEEMNNKLGESAGLKEITPVKESLSILGLRFKEIKKLSPEKQFKAIANAAIKMTDAQKAASAADILLGGEANKIIGVLRQQGKSIDDIIKKYREMSFRSEESRNGSFKFFFQMQRLTGAITTVTREISGLLAGALTPLIKGLNDWIGKNRDLIKQKIGIFVEKISKGIQSLIKYIIQLDQKKPILDRINEGIKSIIETVDLFRQTLLKIQPIINSIGNFFGFFTNMGSNIENASNSILAKSGFTPQAANQNFTPSIISPEQRNMSMIQSAEKNMTEIIIKDETGKAEISKSNMKSNNIKLMSTGSF